MSIEFFVMLHEVGMTVSISRTNLIIISIISILVSAEISKCYISMNNFTITDFNQS